MSQVHRLSKCPLPYGYLTLILAAVSAGCADPPGGAFDRSATAPEGPGAVLVIVVHTVDGRHLKFPETFQPSSIHHCRDDGQRHLTSIHELSLISPGGRRQQLCPEFSDPGLQLNLIFPDRPALKVTLICESCVTPGGYYPPLRRDLYIPWEEISSIEMLRE